MGLCLLLVFCVNAVSAQELELKATGGIQSDDDIVVVLKNESKDLTYRFDRLYFEYTTNDNPVYYTAWRYWIMDFGKRLKCDNDSLQNFIFKPGEYKVFKFSTWWVDDQNKEKYFGKNWVVSFDLFLETGIVNYCYTAELPVRGFLLLNRRRHPKIVYDLKFKSSVSYRN